MRLIRGSLFAVVLALIGLAVSTVTEPPRSAPDLPAEAHPALRACFEGVWWVVDFVLTYPLYAITAVAVVCLPMALSSLSTLLPRRIHTDPQRLFTNQQRSIASSRAGGRCEMETIFFTRCRRLGAAGDHWYPWSLGGATTMDNQVWACTSCNSSKGARIPTFWQTARLEMRRRRYFPPDASLRPGDRVRA